MRYLSRDIYTRSLPEFVKIVWKEHPWYIVAYNHAANFSGEQRILLMHHHDSHSVDNDFSPPHKMRVATGSKHKCWDCGRAAPNHLIVMLKLVRMGKEGA